MQAEGAPAMTVMCALRLVTIEQKMNGWNNASYLHRQEEGTPAMTVMCALRLVTIDAQVWQPSRFVACVDRRRARRR